MTPTDRLIAAARAVHEARQSTFKARNGRDVGIEADDGEKCFIVHSDQMFELEQALAALKPVESGWLVENDQNGPCWWGRTPEGEDAFGWTKDSLMALRFARKEDAEAYAAEIGWNDVTATEHQWQ